MPEKPDQQSLGDDEDKTQNHYQNRVINKNIPEFFAKKNANDPITIEDLPFNEIIRKFEQPSRSQKSSEKGSGKVESGKSQ